MPRASTSSSRSSSKNSPRPNPMSSTGIATHEAGREVAVTARDVVRVAAEVRVERVGLVPGVEPRARNTRRDLGQARAAVCCICACSSRELQLQIVELLDHAVVVRVGEHVRRLRHERDRARDPVRLVLRLLEHALDLATDALGDGAVHRRAAGQPALDGRWRRAGTRSDRGRSTAWSSSASRNEGVGARSPVTRAKCPSSSLRDRAGTRRRAGGARPGPAASREGGRDRAGSGRARTSCWSSATASNVAASGRNGRMPDADRLPDGYGRIARSTAKLNPPSAGADARPARRRTRRPDRCGRATK